MALCSRDTIPSCVVCDGPTMEAGADDRPVAPAYDENGYVCSARCLNIDTLAKASPTTDWLAILDAALALTDEGDLRMVRVHRPSCEPVEGVVFGRNRLRVDGETVILSYTLEDANGEEIDVLGQMVERVEVVEGAV